MRCAAILVEFAVLSVIGDIDQHPERYIEDWCNDPPDETTGIPHLFSWRLLSSESAGPYVPHEVHDLRTCPTAIEPRLCAHCPQISDLTLELGAPFDIPRPLSPLGACPQYARFNHVVGGVPSLKSAIQLPL
jgi:hypothetical protein